MKLGLGLSTVLKVSVAKFLRLFSIEFFFTLLEVFGNYTHDLKNYP